MISNLEHVDNLNNKGYTIIKNALNTELIDKVIKDINWHYSLNNYNNNYRVTNFHMYNANMLNLITNKYVDDILRLFFNQEQTIYTSIFFKVGSSAYYHRDTPQMHTNPMYQYCGVWYALEDIDVKAGPFKYYVGSNKLEDIDGHKIYNKIVSENTFLSFNERINRCQLEYSKVLTNLCKKNNLISMDNTNYFDKIDKGDVIIYHPKLLHGGSNIIDHSLTRYSVVTHNVPLNTQVFDTKHFFTDKPTNEYLNNICKFKYIKCNNVNVIDLFSYDYK